MLLKPNVAFSWHIGRRHLGVSKPDKVKKHSTGDNHSVHALPAHVNERHLTLPIEQVFGFHVRRHINTHCPLPTANPHEHRHGPASHHFPTYNKDSNPVKYSCPIKLSERIKQVIHLETDTYPLLIIQLAPIHLLQCGQSSPYL